MIKRTVLFFQFILLFSFSYASVSLSLDGGSLLYSSTEDIAGFQFSHDGCVAGASGGDAAANGFTISASSSVVLAFSFTGSVIPAGEGTLLEIDGDCEPENLTSFIFSSSNGGSLDVEYDLGDSSDDGGDDASCPDGTEVCLTLDGSNLNYISTSDIAGFQFGHDGCITAASGGDAAANGFTISASSSVVLAFSFTGSVIPAGEGTLVELSGDVSEDCLSGFVFSDINGDPLTVEFASESFDDGGGGASCPDGTEVCLTLDEENLNYSSTEDIAGFQFNHNGCVTGASGGDAEVNGFTISASGSAVLAFSFTGSVVPAGEGTLVVLEGDVSEDCISNLVFSDVVGDALSVSFPFVETLGCTDSEACNYDESANTDDGSCTYADENYDCDGNCTSGTDCAGECGGSAEIDCAGVCGGDSALDDCGVCDGGNADQDCAGVCFGDSALDDCGVCDGGNADQDCAGECGGSAEIDCAGVCGGDSALDDCGVCDGGNSTCDLVCPDGTEVCLTLNDSDLNYSSTEDIGGFQFNHDGCVAGASGGDAAANGFTISASSSVVLAFSFTGSVIPAGEGTLVELSGDVSQDCLSDFVFSNSTGEALSVSFPIATFYGCTDDAACNFDDTANSDDGSCEYPEENYDCDGNCTEDIDCNGNCGGDAAEDDCGICEGDGSTCTVQLSFGEVGDTSLEIIINTPAEVGGFQFAIPSIATFGSAFGGLAEENGFTVSTSNTGSGGMVLGFSFTGSTIPTGSGILINIDYSCDYPGTNTACIDDIVISDPFGNLLPSVFVGDCAEVGQEIISGCTDSGACNFNSDANSDDGSCLYDDCGGECGGSAELDDCGVCEGDGESCEVYIESSVSTSVDESVLDDLDAFEEDFESYVETELDLPEGSVEVTEITVSTSSRDDIDITIDYTITLTEEELAETEFTGEDDISDALEDAETEIEEDGGLPDFVYGCTDESADNYNPEANVDDGSCQTGGPSEIDYCIDLHFGANLISFYALPEDVSVGNMMSSLEGVVTGVIGEGVAASPNPVLGWVGSLSDVSPTSGYWVKVSEGSQLCLSGAAPLDASATTYNLHFGANLISFPSADAVDLATAIPDDVEGAFTGVIGEGVAASPNPVLGWVGSLSSFEGGKGYWAKVDAAIEFEFIVDETSSRIQADSSAEDFGYTQSTEQAFYFIEDVRFNDGSSIESGDMVLAYNENVLVGAREWTGSFTDIPAMGSDGSFSTAGYCNNQSAPEFRVIKSSTGEEFILDVDAPVWSSNEIYQLGTVYVASDIAPDSFDISSVYPNPFNPSTNIMVDIAEERFATISVYNANGQEVSSLWCGVLTEGSHSFTWNGVDQPSGVYFARLNIDGAVSSAKLMLIK